MSIEQKIAALLDESKKLQAEELNAEEIAAEEVVIEEAAEEVVIEEEAVALDEAAVSTIAKAHGFEKGTGMNKGSFVHPKTGESITALRGGDEFGHSAKDGSTVAAFKSKHSLEKHLASHGYTKTVKEEVSVDVSEDVAALVNGEELSEEFKTKAATIFEAAVVTRVKAEVAKIEEEFDTKLAEQVETIKEGLVEKVDGYLNYVVEQWMTDNELALENGMKTEIMESFITGMKGLFEQHYIDVPEEKFDIVGDLQEEVEATTAKLDEQLAANVELTKQINEMKRLAAIAESSADMTDIDVEKFKGLAEELSYEDADNFKTKLQTIKENYFGKKVTTTVSSVVTDEPVQLQEETTLSPQMAAALRALGGK